MLRGCSTGVQDERVKSPLPQRPSRSHSARCTARSGEAVSFLDKLSLSFLVCVFGRSPPRGGWGGGLRHRRGRENLGHCKRSSRSCTLHRTGTSRASVSLSSALSFSRAAWTQTTCRYTLKYDDGSDRSAQWRLCKSQAGCFLFLLLRLCFAPYSTAVFLFFC